jgi:hypothetical protein
MYAHGQSGMQRHTNRAMVGRGRTEQRMHVTDRQQHRNQQQNDAGADGKLADSECLIGIHGFYSLDTK